MASNQTEQKALKGKRGKNDRISARFTDPGYTEQIAAGKPQAVVKVISQARGFRAQKVMEYIARAEGKDGEQSLEFEDAKGEIQKGRDAIEQKYEKWREKFERAKPGQKNPPRHVTHLMLSASTENNDKNARKVLAAAREVLREHLGDKGYDYIMALHRDTDRPHVHVVVNNYHQGKDRQKLRLNPPELFAIRAAFAERLRELGIEQAATLRRDRPQTLENVRKGMERLQERGNWLEAKMKRAAPSVDALKERQALAKSIAGLREQVKKATGPLTKERREYMAALTALAGNLTKPGVDLQKQIDATIKTLEKEHGQVRAMARSLQPGKDAPKPGFRQQLERRRVVDKLTERAMQNIGAAMKTVQAAQMAPEKKAKALQQLRSLQRGFGKGAEISR